MYKLKKIIIYPIKSMGGIELSEAVAKPKGLNWDRRWMLVDVNGKFQTQRELAKLALFKTKLSQDAIEVSFKSEVLKIPLSDHNPKERNVNVFEHNFVANEIDDNCNKWFSDLLNKKVQLVKMTENTQRIKAFKKPPYETKVSMADGYPYLILGTSSVELLNEKLDFKLSEDRFRANLFVETERPHEEDNWENISIGEAQFLNIKPCARCQVPTINQQDGTKGFEPIKTLATYRKFDNKINFGTNAILKKEGKIQVGQPLIFK